MDRCVVGIGSLDLRRDCVRSAFLSPLMAGLPRFGVSPSRYSKPQLVCLEGASPKWFFIKKNPP